MVKYSIPLQATMMTMTYTIALHGDLATAEMLRRDVGDLRDSIDLFFDARGWLRFDSQIDKLHTKICQLPEPPTLIGFSRGVSAIARLSEITEIKAAVVYEGPIIDSEGVGGNFPVLMIWNDAGAKFSPSKLRRGQAKIAEQIWSESHPVTYIQGTGRHMRLRPPGHYWDCSLNQQIKDFIRLI